MKQLNVPHIMQNMQEGPNDEEFVIESVSQSF